MFKELRKQIRLSEEAEVSASTGQEVDLDELNEEEVVDTEDKTLEEIVSLFEDEVLTMDAEDAERLMTEDDDEEEDSEEETLEEDDKDRNINRGSRLAVKAAKFINKKEKSSKVKSVKHNVREATTDEVERLSKKRKITTYLMFGLGAKFVEKNYNTNDKATVISVEVEYENGKKDIVVFAGLTNSKPSEVKNKLESTLKDLKAGKQIKEDEDVEGTEDGAKLDTLEEAYNFLFEEDSEEDSEEDLDKELEEMISFLEGDDEEADEVEEKEEEAKEKLAEALNAIRALKKAKRNRR